MRRTRRTVALAGSALGLAGAVTAAAIGFGGADPAPDSAGRPPATAPVTRITLTQTQHVSGTLGFGPTTAVSAHGGGTITWLPAPGAVISRGQPVYRADNVPVSLFYGDLPLYRPLAAGATGDDVAEVEQNLADLGYTGFTVDTTFTAGTATAVLGWQHDHGLEQSGVVEPSTVVLAAGPVRIASLTARPGEPADGPLLTYSGTVRVVTIALDVALQSLVRPGVPAVVTLPDGVRVDGELATVGSVATAGADDRQPATIAVTVTLPDQSRLGTLDQAPVAVALTSATVANVLTVPVAALVALAEGGYGVQVVTGSSVHYVAVRLGMFASGRVEISGDGITEGTIVGVPA